MADHNLFQDAAVEALKASPPVVVTGSIVAGITISDVVALMTLAYVILQIGLLLPKYREQWKLWKQERSEDDDE